MFVSYSIFSCVHQHLIKGDKQWDLLQSSGQWGWVPITAQHDNISSLMCLIRQLPLFTLLFYCYQVSYLQVGRDSHLYETQRSESIISYFLPIKKNVREWNTEANEFKKLPAVFCTVRSYVVSWKRPVWGTKKWDKTLLLILKGFWMRNHAHDWICFIYIYYM